MQYFQHSIWNGFYPFNKKKANCRTNYKEQHGDPVPGTVLYARKGTLAIMCQDKPLLLLELQPASGKRMKAIDCAHNFEVGAKMEDEAE